MIESMEKTPDLTITFLSGKKVVVKDSPEELIQRIVDYRRRLGISAQEI
jgi:flagellar protein FlbD